MSFLCVMIRDFLTLIWFINCQSNHKVIQHKNAKLSQIHLKGSKQNQSLIQKYIVTRLIQTPFYGNQRVFREFKDSVVLTKITGKSFLLISHYFSVIVSLFICALRAQVLSIGLMFLLKDQLACALYLTFFFCYVFQYSSFRFWHLNFSILHRE